MSWHTRHLELDWLRALVTIVDCGGFSAAAEQLGRSQSAISLQIKRLEDTVGQPVLRRSQGRVDGPTSEGRVLLDYARRMLRLNDEAWACFAQPQMAGRLRLGLPEELMEQVFAPVQAAFARLYPRVSLSVRCDLSVRLAALAEAGELDLALAKRVGGQPASLSGEAWRVLRREPLHWFDAEGSNARDGRPLPLAVFHEGCVFRGAALSALHDAGLSGEVRFVGSSIGAMRHAVLAGLALAPLPASLAAPGMRSANDSLPPLPACELVARYGVGEQHPAAERLWGLFAEQLGGGTVHHQPGQKPCTDRCT